MDNKILSSVAVFKVLYDSEKNLYSVIFKFITAIISEKSLWNFSIDELINNLQKEFELEIPNEVIKATLKHRKGINLHNGTYYVDIKEWNKNSYNNIEQSFDLYNEKNKILLSELTNYVYGNNVSKFEKDAIERHLKDYLLGSEGDKDVIKKISEFILDKKDEETKILLNVIKEGLIIHEGLEDYPDLNNVDAWDNNLTIYLDTELLFDAMGYHNDAYFKIFQDLKKYIIEINSKKPNTINLKYFESTKKEINKLFYTSELIITKNAQIDNTKQAVCNIVKNCHTKSDVAQKKADFYRNLGRCNITLENNEINIKEYNVYDSNTINEITSLYNGSIHGKQMTYDECEEFLRKCSTINTMRHGTKSKMLEKAKCIFLTANSKNLYISRFLDKDDNNIYAVDTDYMINKFWFKLQKGIYANSQSKPYSFDIVTKAKIILSSILVSSISDAFEQCKTKFKNQETTKEAYANQISKLRQINTEPDDITKENFDNSYEYITEEYITESYCENEYLKGVNANQTKENEKLKKEIIKLRNTHFSPQKKIYKILAKFLSYLSFIIKYTIIFIIFFSVLSVILVIKSNMTLEGKIGIILSITSVTFVISRYLIKKTPYLRKKLYNSFVKKYKEKYRNLIKN